MGLLENLGGIFKKAETSKKVVVKKSSVRISDKSNKDRQDATGSKIFPRESPGTNPQAGQNGSGINVDFSGFGDIFDFLSGSPTKTGPRSGADLFFTLEITPKTADSGTDYDLEVTHTEPCISCDGSGNESRRVSTCSLCGGGGSERKEIESPQGRFVQVKTCSACGGRGTVPDAACKECGGTGHVYVDRFVTVHIPAGTGNYAWLRFEGLGDAGGYHGKNGDLIVQVRFC